MSLLARDFLAPFRRRTAPAARAPLAEPPASRARGRDRKNRLVERLSPRAAPFGMAESLERRLALAVDVAQITGNGFFFVDTGQGRVLDSEYSGYSITNNDPVTYADVWVQAHDFTGGVINLSPNEDGVYHLGQLDPGEIDRAWFYLSATGGSLAPQSHQISVYDGDPREGGTLISGPASFTFDRVEETIEASSNKVFSVSYDTATPVLGGTLAMTVTGDLGQAGGDSVLFTPDTFNTWRPDVFELETMTITITGTNARTVTDQLFLTGFAQESENLYTAIYTFRVVDVIATETPVSPTQFVGRNTLWKHDQPLGVAFPPVPAVTNPLLLQKLVAEAGSMDPPAPAITVPDTGATVEFTLTFSNSSMLPASLDSIRDTLPPGTAYVPGSATFAGLPIGDPTIVGSELTWLGPFAVPPMGTATLTFDATMPAVTGVYVNSSVGRIGSVQIDTTTNTKDNVPATATVTVAKIASLSIEKTDDPDQVTAGGTGYTYTLTVTNSGPSDAQNVVVVDDLPAGFVATGFSGPGSVTGTDPFTWTIGTLAAGGTAQLVVTYSVNADVAPGIYTNTATATSPTDPTPPPPATEETEVVAIANLLIEKTDDPDQVTAGGVGYTYTLSVTNSGLSDAQNVVVVDDLPAGFVATGFSGPGTVTGTDPFTWTIGTLAAGGTAQLVVTYSVNADVTPGIYTNTATVTSPTDPNPPPPATEDTEVVAIANLLIEKTDDPDQVTAGGVGYTYTLSVTNSGLSDAQNVVVVDDLPAGFVATGFSGPGTVTGTDPFTWTIGTLAAGGTAQLVVTYSVNADVAAGIYTNTATATSPTDPTPPPPATEDTTVVTIADLLIEKTDDPDQVTAGGVGYTYTLKVTNSGFSDAQNVVVVDDLPAGFVATGFAGPGTVTGTDPFTWTLPTLAAGTSAQLVVTYSVNADVAPGIYTNTATATSPTDPTPPPPATEDTTVVAIADLSIEKTDDPDQVTAGGVGYTYTLTVRNTGLSDAQNVVVVDDLPAGFVATGFSGPGTVMGTDPFTWTIGTLAAGGSAELVVTYSVNADVAPGIYTNTATATSPTNPTPPPPATEETEVVASIELDVTKTGDDTYKGGGLLNFTVVVTNQGLSFASGVQFTDALPAGVVSWSWSVSYTGTGSGTADGSPDSVTDSTAGIDKLMNLAVLGTATFTITALTNADFKSDITNTAVATIGEESATDSWSSAYDGPINPTADVGALVVTNDDLCFGLPLVRVLEPTTGAIVSEFLAYEPSFRGSVRVATGDVTGDGVAEIIVAPGRNRIGQIRVFTPEGRELRRFRTFPFGNAYRGGVDVAVGDIDGDGVNDIIASRTSGPARVNVFRVDLAQARPVTATPFRTFLAFGGAYRNGTVITAGDFGTFVGGVKVSAAADGIAEIAAGTNAGIRAQVRVFDASAAPRQVGGFVAFRAGFTGGVTLSTARWDADAVDDIVVGAGVGGRSLVDVYGGSSFTRLARLGAFSSFARPNAVVNAAALDIDGDGIADSVFGVQGRGGSGGTPGVRRFDRISTATSTLPGSVGLAPPLRIAPITLRLLGG